MPLVVPGMQSNDNSKTSDWMNKLTGKKIGDASNETTFAKNDLPKQHRVVKDGDMMTMDHNPESERMEDEVDADDHDAF
ncbi:hypothetical protein B0A50_03011 [Salinomyces thailandicus]|uniref:Uncharacterized protein n=1 Tax=Salinomyces thailandicus TaxID=706561 RepID=A0A4U0U1U1_9PEZI|nr:hypothetical protein B0A50_03011 [Salinomyces thailandica]